MTLYHIHKPLDTRQISQSTGSTDSESESSGGGVPLVPGGGTRALLGCGVGRARLPRLPPEVERLAVLAVLVPALARFCFRRASAAAALTQRGGV